jgi:hypothetical protein
MKPSNPNYKFVEKFEKEKSRKEKIKLSKLRK